MRYTKYLRRNTIQLNCLILQGFLAGFLLIVATSLVFSDEERSSAWQAAFALVDEGNHKSAVLGLVALLQTELSELERLEIQHALGYNYEKLGNRLKAVHHYALATSPNYPLSNYAVYRLAGLYKDMKNTSQAIEWYAHLVENFPTGFYFLEAKWALTGLYLDQKRYEAAKSHLSELVMHPQYARKAAFRLARCNERLGNISAAFNVYRELIKETQADSIAKEALECLKALRRENVSLKLMVTDQINCGLVCLSHKQWESVVEELEGIPETVDVNIRAQALYLIGQSYRGSKRYDIAIKTFNAVLALGHRSELVDDALYALAHIYETQGRPNLAFNAYVRLIEVSPESPHADVAVWRVGWQYFDERRYEESYATFKSLKENFPGNRYAMGAHFWMAKIRERQNQAALARELYQEVAKAQYWYYTARAKVILGATGSKLAPKAAADSELPVLAACPQQVGLLMELRLYEDAIAHLNHHISTTRFSQRECFYDLLMCYERLARYDKAQQLAEQAFENPAFANPTQQDLEWLHQKLYPRYYAEIVEKYAKLYRVDAFLISAMILEESRYNAAAVSPQGATGLMQIMPATGEEFAQRAKIRRFELSMLEHPEVNIQLGTKYIDYLNSIFKGVPMLVIGAYNRGPGWMRQWVASRNMMDIDELVEKITNRGVRLHIKKVINSYDKYVEIYRETVGIPLQ